MAIFEVLNMSCTCMACSPRIPIKISQLILIIFLSIINVFIINVFLGNELSYEKNVIEQTITQVPLSKTL